MTTLFNYDPYYDDFDEDKNFMRVLFRPEYAVQARELTQLQTILSNQIEKFGNHIFKSGSPVVGGKISLDSTANYIILNSQYNNEDVVPTDFLDKTIISSGSTKRVRARVIAVDTVDNYPVLVLKYLSGDRFVENDIIKINGQNIYAQLRDTAAYGASYVASIQDGIYYFKGQFVKVTPQFLVVELFYRLGNSTTINRQPSYKIGVEFEEKIIDEIDDTSLLDPAQGAFNYQAPGAERFQIVTTLSKRTLDSADVSSFFEVIRLVNGVKTKEINYPIYSEIEKTLARRTYDESGNYTIDPFVITLEEGDTANGKFNVVLDPGKAYVGGYEFETIAPTTIELNRARETSNVSDYDIITNYESSVVLNTIYGTLDITGFPALDIHCVTHTTVNTTTTAAYNSTKIGEIRASMMSYNDSTALDNGTTHSFTINTFSANSVPITGNVVSGSTNTVIKLPPGFSATAGANAYANMFFRITQGAGAALDAILITESSASANTITLQSSLPFTPGTANTFTIESDFANAESFVKLNGGTTKVFGGNIDSDSKDAITGFASISEPNRSSLIFDLPYSAMKAGTLANLDFYAKKIYAEKISDAGGVITIAAEGTDTFAFAGTPGTISDTLIRDNIICFVRSDSATNTASGIVANSVLSLANNLFTVTAVSSTQFTIDLDTSGVKVDLLITSKVNNANNSTTGAIRGKQLIPLTTGANLHAKVAYEMNAGGDTLEAANSATKTAITDGWVFNDIGSTFFTGSTTLQDLRTPGKTVSLQVPDVYEIVRITDSKSPGTNVTTAMLTSDSYDITDNYEFDNGQRKTHYDHASIKLKRGYAAPTGTVYVQYKYLKHSSAPSPQNDGLFTVDSYLKTGSNFTYDEIFSFNNKEDKKLVSLRSAFDFRPTRGIGTSTLSGAVNPIPTGTLTSNFEYYLSRVDQIVVKPTREFEVITGKSAVNAIAPNINKDDMLIYTLTIPAYTESVKDIRADFYNQRRYTMTDIGAFENRIKQLEYYVALNSLEKDAASTKILDANGLERSKYGILVDNFTTDEIKATKEEVGFDNRCLIDKTELKPASLMRTVKLTANSSLSTGDTKLVGINDKKVMMLNYTTSELASQPLATKSLGIASALFANFKGSTRLFPEFSGDVDTETTARVTLNSAQGLENAFNFVNSAFKYISDQNKQWADDKDSPFAQVADSLWYETRTEVDTSLTQTRFLGGRTWGNIAPVNDNTYLTKGAILSQKQITTSSSTQTIGDFVTDLAIQPYMTPKQILFVTTGVRPLSSMYSFFDDVDVNKYVVVSNRVTLNANTTLISGENALIANTIADLTANISSLLSGGTNYSPVSIVVNEVGSANVSLINETGKPLTSKYIYGIESGKTLQISSVNEHHSGVGIVSGNTITLAADASSTTNAYSNTQISNYTSNTISIIRSASSFDGIGEQFTIVSYNGTTKVATLSGTPTTTGSVLYSIGGNKSDIRGQVGGAFYMPRATFRSGQRNFRVTESFNNTYDGDAISFADKQYVSSGISANKTQVVDTVYNVDVDYKVVGTQTSDRLVSSTRIGEKILNTWNVDPLAQTFFIDAQLYPNGIFLDSLDLFFRAKDDELPVTLQIRPTINGIPSSDYWYPESVVVKQPSEINVSETPSILDTSTITNFKFYSPIYLKPGLYAIVLLAQTPDYVVWEAEKGALTTNNEFVSVNPYVGTLYKSQNSMEYVPYLNEDLMFRINRCVFSTGPASFVLENQAQSTEYNVDKVRLLETSIVPAGTTLSHSLAAKTIDGNLESTYRNISAQQTLSFENDDLYAVGFRRKALQNRGDFRVKYELTTSSSDVSPIISIENSYLNIWENFIENAEINAEDYVIVAPGTGYANANVIYITSTSGTGATANLSCDANGNIIGIFVSSVGSGYIDDFSVSIGANSTYPTVAASGTGGQIVVNSEYDSSGGPCLARYITKAITLADGFDAGDLRVFVAANKPSGTEIEVFCKLLSQYDTTPFRDREYQKLVCINPTTATALASDEFTDYEFRPSATDNFITYTSDTGVTYDTFKTFAIKIVMRSTDGAIYPRCKDLRIIALPAE